MIAWLPWPRKLFLTVRSLCSLWWILLPSRELLSQLKPLFSNSCWLSAMRASFLVGMSLLRIVWKLTGLFGTLGSSPDWILQDSPPHGFCSAFLLFPPFTFTPVPSPLKPLGLPSLSTHETFPFPLHPSAPTGTWILEPLPSTGGSEGTQGQSNYLRLKIEKWKGSLEIELGNLSTHMGSGNIRTAVRCLFSHLPEIYFMASVRYIWWQK